MNWAAYERTPQSWLNSSAVLAMYLCVLRSNLQRYITGYLMYFVIIFVVNGPSGIALQRTEIRMSQSSTYISGDGVFNMAEQSTYSHH